MGFIQRIELEEFPTYCAHCKVFGHSKVECHILNPPLANIPAPNVVGLDMDVGDKIVDNVVPVLSGENPIDDVVLSVNDLPNPTSELVPIEVVINIVESPLVGNESLVPDMVREGAVDSSLHDFNVDQGVLVGNQVVNCDQVDDGVASTLLNLAKAPGEVEEEGKVKAVVSGALVSGGSESLVEVSIIVMSPNGLYAHCVSNLGVTYSGHSIWHDGYPSLLGEMGEDSDVEQDDSFKDLYGLDVIQVAEKVLSCGSSISFVGMVLG
ncbi:hypothetical protein M5K25_010039 [Dendrobium thyrsiflorum]|uniref:Uncharacterized protein n=1 Tax=Dendrobium thyrsiflorum TaxID=117978 RepID=A0ABD0V621_DENTH